MLPCRSPDSLLMGPVGGPGEEGVEVAHVVEQLIEHKAQQDQV